VIVFGRRRIGKTRLLLEFLKWKSRLYFYIREGGDTILSELSKVVEKDFLQVLDFLSSVLS